MDGVSTQFLVLEIVEVALIAGGGTMAYLGNDRDRPQLEGAGYALAAEAAATLVFADVAVLMSWATCAHARRVRALPPAPHDRN